MSSIASFTLAEVLITLTIVGVIAALTIPNLMHQYKQKEYETRFNKAYNEINRVFKLMQIEDDPDLWGKYADGATLGTYYSNEFRINFRKYFKDGKNKRLKGHGPMYMPLYIKTYTKDMYVANSGCNYSYLWNIQGGTDLEVSICWSAFSFFVDIDGSNAGPNALGHDVFIFGADKEQKIRAYYNNPQYHICSTTAKGNGNNGYGCTMYAILNKCPDNPSKTYWECLPR